MVITNLCFRFGLFFVKNIYLHNVVSNRLYNKDAKDEESEFKIRQFFIIMTEAAFVFAFVALCLGRYVFGVSVESIWSVVVCFALGALVSFCACRKINRLGLYDKAVCEVLRMDVVALRKCYYQTMFQSIPRLIVVPVVVFCVRWLLLYFL